MNAPATVEAIRSAFPALRRKQGSNPVAYFDGPGGTQVPSEVAHAMTVYLLKHNANTAWAYPASEETDAMLEGARDAAADFLNARPSEIAFGNNMTTLTFHLARALGAKWGKGDEIVVTDLDHHANVAPWKRLEKERGVTVRHVGVHVSGEQQGQLDWASFEAALNSRTKLVAVGAASNGIGTISDVARAVRMAHAVGALAFVDAVHYAPHELVDVREWDCDFLACSGYKFYGPHMGILYGKEALVRALDVPKLDPAPDWPSENLETGTQNHEGIAGALATINFLAGLAEPAGNALRRERLAATYAELHLRAQAHVERLWHGLGAIHGVTLFGPDATKPRTPTVSFTLAGHTAKEVAQALAERAIFVSHGDFYASTIIQRLGQSEHGVVRVGCACYTTGEEAGRVISAVSEIARRA